MTAVERMVAIIVVLFGTMKILVLAMSPPLPPARVIAFLFWPGMRPALFAAPRREVGGVREPLLRGLRNIVCGAAMFVVARQLPLAAAIVLGLPALSLILHFGLFPIATAAWRAAGFDVHDVFRKPWRSQSLAEFWARRWNTGFSEMLAVIVSRPVTERFGRRASIAAAFLASGLLHELAISVPARGGYGLPTLYFALHGALVAFGLRGRLATVLAVVLPLPLLFHAPFVRAVVVPLIG
jgi:hypothetical protein